MQPALHASPKKRTVLPLAIACFVAGGTLGFFAGVLSVREARDFVGDMFQSERAADVSQGVVLDRPAFELTRPGNWKVDTTDSDYDPDHLFSIDSPGQSFVMFVVADGELSPEQTVDKHVEIQSAKAMKNASRTALTTWGGHVGHGVLLTGKLLGISPGTVRIFAFREQDRTYTVIESTYDEDRAKVQPGFDLIARTFRVK